ncbi:hypothetical protein Tco_1390322, partial [Tanacetum coccineum]
RDAYEKKLIQMLKIYTDDNVADLLTKAFDVSSLYEVFSVQKNLDHSDDFHGVIWVLESHWKEIKMSFMSYHLSYAKLHSLCSHCIGKLVFISEASIRSDLLFDDADGIDSLHNQAIFDAIQLMGDVIAKAEPTVHKDPAFDELDDDAIDYNGDEDSSKDVGRQRYVVHEEKESAEKEVSTKDAHNTAPPKVSTDKEEVSTDRPEATSTRSLLTLKPLPKIDPKDKGKKKIEEEDESDTESEGITEAEKKFKAAC